MFESLVSAEIDERRTQSDPVVPSATRIYLLRSPERPEVLLSQICWVEGQEQDQEEQVEQQSGQEQEQEEQEEQRSRRSKRRGRSQGSRSRKRSQKSESEDERFKRARSARVGSSIYIYTPQAFVFFREGFGWFWQFLTLEEPPQHE